MTDAPGKKRKFTILAAIAVAARDFANGVMDKDITYARLMELGFDNDFWLGTTHDQLGRIPAADRPNMWRMIESGDYSLGPFNVMIAKRYGMHLDLEW